jgi:hypothetical protein
MLQKRTNSTVSSGSPLKQKSLASDDFFGSNSISSDDDDADDAGFGAASVSESDCLESVQSGDESEEGGEHDVFSSCSDDSSDRGGGQGGSGSSSHRREKSSGKSGRSVDKQLLSLCCWRMRVEVPHTIIIIIIITSVCLLLLLHNCLIAFLLSPHSALLLPFSPPVCPLSPSLPRSLPGALRSRELQSFVVMMQAGVDVVKIQASLFSRRLARTLFLDARAQDLCWLPPGR